jgi:two-component system chemotaxis response regulator CheY
MVELMAKIITIDDSAWIRFQIVDCLIEKGHVVIEAEDGQEGFEKIQSTSGIDLIITDFNMPKMNGIEMLEKVNKIEGFKPVPIIMLTTESSAELKSEGKKNNVTGWIVKPFSNEKFINAVESLLSKFSGKKI